MNDNFILIFFYFCVYVLCPQCNGGHDLDNLNGFFWPPCFKRRNKLAYLHTCIHFHSIWIRYAIRWIFNLIVGEQKGLTKEKLQKKEKYNKRWPSKRMKVERSTKKAISYTRTSFNKDCHLEWQFYINFFLFLCVCFVSSVWWWPWPRQPKWFFLATML